MFDFDPYSDVFNYLAENGALVGGKLEPLLYRELRSLILESNDWDNATFNIDDEMKFTNMSCRTRRGKSREVSYSQIVEMILQTGFTSNMLHKAFDAYICLIEELRNNTDTPWKVKGGKLFGYVLWYTQRLFRCNTKENIIRIAQVLWAKCANVDYANYIFDVKKYDELVESIERDSHMFEFTWKPKLQVKPMSTQRSNPPADHATSSFGMYNVHAVPFTPQPQKVVQPPQPQKVVQPPQPQKVVQPPQPQKVVKHQQPQKSLTDGQYDFIEEEYFKQVLRDNDPRYVDYNNLHNGSSFELGGRPKERQAVQRKPASDEMIVNDQFNHVDKCVSILLCALGQNARVSSLNYYTERERFFQDICHEIRAEGMYNSFEDVYSGIYRNLTSFITYNFNNQDVISKMKTLRIKLNLTKDQLTTKAISLARSSNPESAMMLAILNELSVIIGFIDTYLNAKKPSQMLCELPETIRAQLVRYARDEFMLLMDK